MYVLGELLPCGALFPLFKLVAQAAADVGVTRKGTDSFRSHMGFTGDSWGVGALSGEMQADPIMPQLMSLPGECGSHLEPAKVIAECSSGS